MSTTTYDREGFAELMNRLDILRHTRQFPDAVSALDTLLEDWMPELSKRLEDPVDIDGVAELMDVTSKTAHSYAAHDQLCAQDGQAGRSPWWWPQSIRDFKVARPGRGAGGGRPKGSKNKPKPEYKILDENR